MTDSKNKPLEFSSGDGGNLPLHTDIATVMRFVLSSPACAAVFDGGGHFMAGNDAYKRMFPETPVPEYSIFEDTIVERNGYKETMDKLKDGEIISIPEMNYNPQDIRPEYPDIQVHISLSATPLMAPDGNLENVIIIYDNKTEQRAAEKNLAEMVRRFEVFSKRTAYAFGEMDADGVITYVNSKAEEITGYSIEELVGMNYIDTVIDHARDEAIENVAKAVEEKFDEPGIFEVVCKDGTHKKVQANIVALKERGELVGFQFTALDVTDQIHAEEEVRKLSQFLSIVFDSANVWMNVLDRDANIILWNKAAEQISGYTREEVLGHAKAWEWIYPDEGYRNSLLKRNEEVVSQGRAVEDLETRIVTKSGDERIISWHSKDLVDENGDPMGVVSLGRDVTYEHRAREETRMLQEQLVQAQKMEAMGTLAGGMAHDFNNSLSVILGNAEIALRSVGEEDPLREKLLRIARSAERAKVITTKLLTFSRKDILNLKPVSVNEIISELVDILRRSVSKKVIISVDADESSGRVLMDANQVLQSFMNICINAADAMPDGGTMCISARREIFGGSRSESLGLEANEYCVVEIRDTGSGIENGNLKKIFDPFFTTKERGKGTGLGLSVTQGIIERHGGAIDVESKPGEGSCFRIYLPLTREEARGVKEEMEERAEGAGEAVLVVDDDEDFAEMMGETLELEGYAPLVVHSGREGLETLREHVEIKVAVIDMKMPEMDGAEMVAAVRDLRPDMPVVICSGFSEDGVAESLLDYKKISFIQKPFRADDIVKTIDSALRD